MAVGKETSVDAAIMAVLQELDGIFTLKTSCPPKKSSSVFFLTLSLFS